MLAIPFLLLLSGCQSSDTNEIRQYLSYKYKLEDCADIHDQDNYKNIWFNDYNGDSYSYLFDLASSYLDMRVELVDGKANGEGNLVLIRKDDKTKSMSVEFSYYCILKDTTGGYVVSSLGNEFSNFVFCIYWCRVNLEYIDPNDNREFTLTLHFRGGTKNEYPSEFDD